MDARLLIHNIHAESGMSIGKYKFTNYGEKQKERRTPVKT